LTGVLVVGVDVGNQTTEVALAVVEESGPPRFLASALVRTTGIKGTVANIPGVRAALERACGVAGRGLAEIALVRINEAVPVVAGVAMQAITETILTDSAVVGHNPDTPGGKGLGVGTTTLVTALLGSPNVTVIAVVPSTVPFDEAAMLIASARAAGIAVVGAIVQADDGVLIANRVPGDAIPIVDEVEAIDAVPLGQRAAVEVAVPGAAIQTLSNPYGIATIFGLDAATTARLAPAARALTGVRSAVVIKTPDAAVRERRIRAGAIALKGTRGTRRIDLAEGAAEVMAARAGIGDLRDVSGDPGTIAGAMFAEIKQRLAEATLRPAEAIGVRDLLAADLQVPQPVAGGLSREVAPERAVALAAMVEADASVSGRLAEALAAELGVRVESGGTEVGAGMFGALTTPGTGKPLVVLDLGSGSTNAARVDATGHVEVLHLAGGGAMVNLVLGEELGVVDDGWREDLKRHRVAHVESLFTLRHEDRSLQFVSEPFPGDLLGRTVMVGGDEVAAVPGDLAVERVVESRRSAKARVFGANAERALRALAPGGNLRSIGFVALIGGSALDFEIPALLAARFAEFGIVVGTANVRGSEGPRNAVATGLVLGVAAERG
jgi:diol dehydratase reactivase alpha subunit